MADEEWDDWGSDEEVDQQTIPTPIKDQPTQKPPPPPQLNQKEVASLIEQLKAYQLSLINPSLLSSIDDILCANIVHDKSRAKNLFNYYNSSSNKMFNYTIDTELDRMDYTFLFPPSSST